MTTIGIDLSINSTGICVSKNGRYTYYIIAATATKKLMADCEKHKVNIILYDKRTVDAKDKYYIREQSKTHNLTAIASHIRDIVKKHKPDMAFIEGISYGSSSTSNLADLAGLNYLVRSVLTSLGVDIYVVSPKANKHNATGNGNAGKDLMIDCWKLCDKKIAALEGKIDDLADAFFLAATKMEEL